MGTNKDDMEKFKVEPLLVGRTEITTQTTQHTNIVSLPGSVFTGQNPATDNITVSGSSIQTVGVGIVAVAPLIFPNGVTLTNFTLIGTIAVAETWQIYKHDPFAGLITVILSGNINTEATGSIIIDNGSHNYFVITSALSANDIIRGIKLTYLNKAI